MNNKTSPVLKTCLISVTALFMFIINSNVYSIGQRQLHCDQSTATIRDSEDNLVILRGFGIGNWLLPEGYMWLSGHSDQFPDCPRKIEPEIVDLIGEEDANEFWKLYHENYLTEQDIQAMKGWGCNSIRISLNHDLLMPRDSQPDNPPFNYSDYGFALLDSAVK